MSIVRGNLDKEDYYVAVKVVSTDRGWDVTRSANRQNEIGKLELQIAEFLRPQRIKKVAASKGIAIDSADNAISVLNAVYKKSVIYDDMRALFIGLFSRDPVNLFESGEEAILTEVLSKFYEYDREGEQLFDNLFTIQLAASNAISDVAKQIEEISQTSKGNSLSHDIYQRFFKENINSYRAYLTLLASCAACGIDISEQGTIDMRFTQRKNFMNDTITVIENSIEVFNIYYEEAFKQIVSSTPKDIDVSDIKQRLWSHMKKQKFSRLLEDTMTTASITLRRMNLR